ncbi:ABC transporter permease [Pseudoalteromonas denitrificans]|uniref:Duplicated orphan permease n=1 Tax=Pseudoalteromonas denitrificans DSM 6059 TaxID=1123010 RepID=A0A1I1TJJ3_9GAMM|nr:ABC transporter permease [Pseudoalteromonas denitrificans]SFD57338.1 duplicated orphan permease [Pseudoalteromonas denitrificans DSM 6059]
MSLQQDVLTVNTHKNNMIEKIGIDVRYALSRIISQLFTSLIIVLTLALSIGATTAIFSVVNGLLFQATPFKDAENLVILEQKDIAKDQSYGFSASEILDYQNQSQSFEDISEYHNMTFTMYGHGDPIRVRTGVVSSNFFSMLNLTPILGRTFTEAEDDIGAEPLVVLTYEFWQSEFNASDDIVNQSVEFNNRSHKIIGVLPHFPQFPDVNDVYMAIPSCPWRSSENALSNRGMRMMTSFAKIKSDFDLEDVNNEIATIAGNLNKTYPEAYSDNAKMSAKALSLHDELVKSSRPYLYTLLATTLLLFLIACANVTNLTLSQHAKRKREFAVRSSLGASKAQIAQLLLIESLILALSGGALGLIFAFFGLDFLKDFASNFSSLASEISIDTNVMLFALTISIISGMIAGIVPSFSKINLVSSLKEGGKSSYSTDHGILRNGLLICQFALSLTLLISAGLTIKSLNNLQKVDAGFSPQNVEISQIDLNWTVYNTAQLRWQISQQILQEVEKLPYVTSSALAMTYPNDTVGVNYNNIRQSVQLDDRDFDPDHVLPNAFLRPITHDYFKTIDSQLLQGRFFSIDDDDKAPNVIIINQKLAKKWWPNESAINHSISLDQGRTWFNIVGIIEDIHEQGGAVEPSFQIYQSLAQAPSPHIAILVKHDNHSNINYEQDIRNIVTQLDSRQPISKFENLQQALDNSVALQRFLAQLLTIFSIIALVMTVSGVSGVMSYMVNLRTREIGIRMAIGADKLKVIILILSYGMRLTLFGLLIGFISAYFSGDWLSEQLFDIKAFDFMIYGIALAVLLLISFLACLLPAWRASSIPPIHALKSQ